MKKLLILTSIILISTPIFADSLKLKFGQFSPSQESDLWDINRQNLYLEKKDFEGSFVSVEWEVFMKRNLSFSLEIGAYSRELTTSYRDWEYEDGSPIYQSLSLSIVPIEASFKIYPGGAHRPIAPYLGGGFGIYFWKYIQEGDFVDFTTWDVFSGSYETSTSGIGTHIRGGISWRISRSIGFFGEAKYVYLKDNLSSQFQGFEKFDLSGLHLLVGISIWY